MTATHEPDRFVAGPASTYRVATGRDDAGAAGSAIADAPMAIPVIPNVALTLSPAAAPTDAMRSCGRPTGSDSTEETAAIRARTMIALRFMPTPRDCQTGTPLARDPRRL